MTIDVTGGAVSRLKENTDGARLTVPDESITQRESVFAPSPAEFRVYERVCELFVEQE